MSNFYILDNPPIIALSGNVYQTAIGRVLAPHGAGVSRQVKIYTDGMETLLAMTVSNLPLGDFTVQYMGFTFTPVTVIVKGEAGENSTIDSHCQAA